MNELQTFMAQAHEQTSPVTEEAFSFVGAPLVVFLGTFGNPQIMGVMTRTGYEDHLVTPMTARAALWTAPPLPLPLARSKLVRTQTGRTFFVQVVDTTNPVVFSFVLTDREL